MRASKIVRLAFENVAPHISNLDDMHEIVQEMESDYSSVEAIMEHLELIKQEAETTLQTDIRILTSEIRHIVMKENADR